MPAAPNHQDGLEGLERDGRRNKNLTIRNSNKMIHDVWFCSGQINPQMHLLVEGNEMCYFV